LGAFLLASLLHFYSGQPLQNLSGVDSGTKREDLLAGLRTVGFERRVTIAFMVTDETVLIEGIFYGGQDFETLFHEQE
jgi:hypothetical protein